MAFNSLKIRIAEIDFVDRENVSPIIVLMISAFILLIFHALQLVSICSAMFTLYQSDTFRINESDFAPKIYVGSTPISQKQKSRSLSVGFRSVGTFLNNDSFRYIFCSKSFPNLCIWSEKLQQKVPVVYVQNVYWVVMLGMSLSTSTQCLVEENWYFFHNIFWGISDM